MNDFKTNESPATTKKFQKLIGTHDYIEDFDFTPPEEVENVEEPLRQRADVPVGPSEHDKLVPSSVAQGD